MNRFVAVCSGLGLLGPLLALIAPRQFYPALQGWAGLLWIPAAILNREQTVVEFMATTVANLLLFSVVGVFLFMSWEVFKHNRS